jgi:hypothetical protein
VTPPGFDQDLGLGQAEEDLAVEQLIAQLAVETLAIADLPPDFWTTRSWKILI